MTSCLVMTSCALCFATYVGGLGACPHGILGFRPLETTFSSNLVTVFNGAGKSLLTCKFRREGEGRVGGGRGGRILARRDIPISIPSSKEGYFYIHSIPHSPPHFPFENKTPLPPTCT